MNVLQVDLREPKVLIDALRADAPKHDFEVRIGAFACGDYFVGQRLGVERKSPNDFAASLKDGRLFAQASELASQFSTPIIAVTSSFDSACVNNGYSAINPASLEAAVASLYCHYGVPVLFVENDHFTRLLWRLAAKAADGGVGSYNPIRRSATTDEWQSHFLASLPSVGGARATAILKTYRTPLDALRSWERWADDVPGIGEETVKRVGKVLTEERL